RARPRRSQRDHHRGHGRGDRPHRGRRDLLGSPDTQRPGARPRPGRRRDGRSVMLYLDAAATSPVRREAVEAAWPYLTGSFGNPSSHHGLGEPAAAALDEARRRVAAVLGMRRSDITFTAGGTEAANLAIKG